MTNILTRQNIPVFPGPNETDQRKINGALIEAIKTLDRRIREYDLGNRLDEIEQRITDLEDIENR